MTVRHGRPHPRAHLFALALAAITTSACAGQTTIASGGGGSGGATGGSSTAGGGTGGVTSTCTPETEICDGKDNDCDGQIDNVPAAPNGCACNDGDSQECYSGAAGTDGVGECHKGSQACTNGAWGECTGQVTPGSETCNLKDDDCNGAVDDNIPDVKCGVGACAVSQPACVNGQTQQCMPKPPTTEVCDGIDNNCNQLVDETDPMLGQSCMTGGSGVCAQGKYQCNAGVFQCAGAAPSTEVCDGLDNDCNGTVDDAPGTGGDCSTGALGVCAAGIISCKQVGGAYTIDCFPIVAPTGETCDGLDNNCNGSADEGDPGGGAVCNTGAPGICGPGVLHCQNGAVGCVANVSAQTEVCDGQDNNCNGTVDEGNPGGGVGCATGLPGKCGTGTTSCFNGAIVCNQTVQPSAEVCNGIDDNCNGAIDDGNPGGGAACNTGLLGACAAGTITCQSGQLACAQNVQPTAEVCGNAIDENCDGSAPAAPTYYLNETFASNAAGWTLGNEWGIGPAVASACGSAGLTGDDPATDHSPSADNGVAGVVIGGCYSTNLHSDYCIMSPAINLSAAPSAYLSYYRQLHSDYPSYITNHVDVSGDNGATWTTVFTSQSGTFMNETSWTPVTHNITAQKGAQTRVRFCYTAGSGGIVVGGGWSLDDVQITDVTCQ
ncbi:MAG: MopE-related protein [Polyangiaceae bacterium]